MSLHQAVAQSFARLWFQRSNLLLIPRRGEQHSCERGAHGSSARTCAEHTVLLKINGFHIPLAEGKGKGKIPAARCRCDLVVRSLGMTEAMSQTTKSLWIVFGQTP